MKQRLSDSRVLVLGAAVLIGGSWFGSASGDAAQSLQTRRILSCDEPFAPTMTSETLANVFGAANVTSEDLPVGEGFFEKGTVLFAKSPEDRLEIRWRDENEHHTPQTLVVGSAKTRWRTAEGLTVGSSLLDLERLNGRPFRLSGFGWDYGGGVQSWSGGKLERPTGEHCRMSATLAPIQRDDGSIPNEHLFRQVTGERQYSSGHPAMQVLNPVVRRVYVVYGRSQR